MSAVEGVAPAVTSVPGTNVAPAKSAAAPAKSAAGTRTVRPLEVKPLVKGMKRTAGGALVMSREKVSPPADEHEDTEPGALDYLNTAEKDDDDDGGSEMLDLHPDMTAMILASLTML